MTPAEIIATFERIEDERGGPAMTDAKEIVAATAEVLGITIERAREVMTDHWTMRHSG